MLATPDRRSSQSLDAPRLPAPSSLRSPSAVVLPRRPPLAVAVTAVHRTIRRRLERKLFNGRSAICALEVEMPYINHPSLSKRHAFSFVSVLCYQHRLLVPENCDQSTIHEFSTERKGRCCRVATLSEACSPREGRSAATVAVDCVRQLTADRHQGFPQSRPEQRGWSHRVES